MKNLRVSNFKLLDYRGCWHWSAWNASFFAKEEIGWAYQFKAYNISHSVNY